MRTSKLGGSKLEITKAGLGTWAIGGPWQFGWGRQDDEDSIAAIIESLDAGINWLDTAPIYGCGHSEEIVGKAIKMTRQKPFIATKCGLLWNDRRESIRSLKTKSILAECDASLKRLGVDTIDLYQMHWNEPDEDLEEGYDAMTRCVKAGKVRYLGVSNYTAEQMQRVMKIHPLTSLQPPYSMFRREIEDDILPFCKKNNIGVIVYSPLQKGLLTGKFTVESIAELPDDDVRKRSSEFNMPDLAVNLEIIKKLKGIAQQNGITVAQLAIAWTLRNPEVTAAIVGARRPGQIKETAAAADITLFENDIEKIEKILQERAEKLQVVMK